MGSRDSTYGPTARDARNLGCWAGVGIVLFVVLFGVGIALEAGGLYWYAPWREKARGRVEDARTERIHHQQGYVELYVAKINGAVTEFNRIKEYNPTYKDGDPTTWSAQQTDQVTVGICESITNLYEDDVVDFVSDTALTLAKQKGCYDPQEPDSSFTGFPVVGSPTMKYTRIYGSVETVTLVSRDDVDLILRTEWIDRNGHVPPFPTTIETIVFPFDSCRIASGGGMIDCRTEFGRELFMTGSEPDGMF